MTGVCYVFVGADGARVFGGDVRLGVGYFVEGDLLNLLFFYSLLHL